jgi:hypothetical protein
VEPDESVETALIAATNDLQGGIKMRFMMIVKASKNSEAGNMPGEELLSAMGKYNEELMKAGVLLELSGLHPSSKGARIKFSGGKRTVIDGPFAETKEVIGGFWMVQVKSKQEAIEWAKRAPAPPAKGKKARSRFARCSNWKTSLPARPSNRARELGDDLAKKNC